MLIVNMIFCIVGFLATLIGIISMGAKYDFTNFPTQHLLMIVFSGLLTVVSISNAIEDGK